jgi:hypothetical protein
MQLHAVRVDGDVRIRSKTWPPAAPTSSQFGRLYLHKPCDFPVLSFPEGCALPFSHMRVKALLAQTVDLLTPQALQAMRVHDSS